MDFFIFLTVRLRLLQDQFLLLADYYMILNGMVTLQVHIFSQIAIKFSSREKVAARTTFLILTHQLQYFITDKVFIIAVTLQEFFLEVYSKHL